MKRSWATDDQSRSGIAHLWHEAASEPRMSVSECGRVTMASQLQAISEATGYCKKCKRIEALPSTGTKGL